MFIQYLYIDLKDFPKISSEVLADEVHIDYTDLLGGEPFTTTKEKQTAAWESQLSAYASSQHQATYVHSSAKIAIRWPITDA